MSDSALAKTPLALCVVSFIILIALIGGSLSWPLIHDAPLMHYIAWRIDSGAVPYRDIFDMNFPGTYLVHLGVLRVFGTTDGGWRFFELLYLTLTGLSMFVFWRRQSKVIAALGACLYMAYHVAAGPTLAGQRDFLLLFFLFSSAHFMARYLEEEGALKPLFLSGLLIGVALTIKPTPVLFWGGLGVLAGFLAHRRGYGFWTAPVLLFLTGLVPLTLCLLWLSVIGGLAGFFEVLTAYVLPIYAKIGRMPLSGHISLRHFAVIGALFIAAVVALLSTLRQGKWTIRHSFVAFGLLYGFLHYWLQGKGWGYHLLPFVAFCALAAASAVPRTLLEQGKAALALWTLTCLSFVGAAGYKGLGQGGMGPHITMRYAQLQDLKAELSQCGESVQVLDTAHGGIHALLDLRLVQPTRFIYDFPMLNFVDEPVVQAFQSEFMQDVRAKPPGCIMLSQTGWPDGGFERVDKFPALKTFLKQDYTLNSDHNGYRIYARR